MSSSDRASSASTAPILATANNNDLLFANSLAAAWKSRTWLFSPDLALRRDVNFWEKCKLYPKIAMALQKRAHAVATRDWTIEAGDEEEASETAAEVVKAMFKRIPTFRQSRLRLSRAPILGNANEWMDTRRLRSTSFAKTPPQDWLVVSGLRPIDYRRIRLFPRWSKPAAGGESFIEEVELHLGQIATFGNFKKIENPELLIRSVHEDEEGRLGYGYGLIEPLYYAMWVIELAMREGLEGVERWAQGWVVGTVDQSPFGATDKSAEDVATALFEALQLMRSRGVLLVGKGETIDVKETTGTGHQLVSWFVEHMENAAIELITGSLIPTGSGADVGSNARGEVEERTSDEVVQFDRDESDEALTRDLIGLLWRYNRPQFDAVALGAAMPRFVSVEADHETPEAFLANAKLAHEMGLDLVKEEVYRRAGLTRPPKDAEPDEIVEGAEAVAPGMGAPGDPFADLANAGKGAPGAEA